MIRRACLSDASALAKIYNPYVEKTAITFDETPLTVQEMEQRVAQANYPFLVAEQEGKIVGFASCHQLYPRSAYRYVVEWSIYLAEDSQKQGIGRQLFEQLCLALKPLKVGQVYACIAYTEKPDNPSIRFHKGLGFKQVGQFENCGWKFNQWHSVLWMVKSIESRV